MDVQRSYFRNSQAIERFRLVSSRPQPWLGGKAALHAEVTAVAATSNLKQSTFIETPKMQPTSLSNDLHDSKRSQNPKTLLRNIDLTHRQCP